jgi:hypothetical protein
MLNIEALRDLCRTATEKDPATMPDEEWD